MVSVPRFAILAPALLLALGACAQRQIQNNQGYVADEELVASVQPGVDNKDSVAKALGRPTSMTQWDGNTWFYISRNTRQLAFARPVPRSQSILIVHFTKDGTVAQVERRGMDQVVDISPNSDRTPTLGREATLLEDLFGNIGTVSAGGGPQ